MAVKLIYHTPGETSRRVSPFDTAIMGMNREKDVRLAAPYLSLKYVKRVIEKCDSWRVLTDVQEWISSQSANTRLEIERFITSRSEKVHHYPDLHAKVVIAGECALLGSANFTDKGIKNRIEMCALFENTREVAELRDWFDRLWQLSAPADSDQLSTFMLNAPTPTNAASKYRISSTAPKIDSKIAYGAKKPDLDDRNSIVDDASPAQTKRNVNVNMFTAENMVKFKEKVGEADKNGCTKWLGSINKYAGKAGVRHFGLFRVKSSGYVMNQRFAFIMAMPVAMRNTGIKVEPIPTCKLGELCCTPIHIRAKAEGRKRRMSNQKAGAR